MMVLHQQPMTAAGRIVCEIYSLQVYPSYRLPDGNYGAKRSPRIRLISSRESDDGRCENEADRLSQGKRRYVV